MVAAPAEPVSPRLSVAEQPGGPRESRRLSGVCHPKACAGEIASRPRADALRIRVLVVVRREMPPPRRSDHWDHERRTCAFASKTAPETGKSDIAYSSNTLLWTPKGPFVFNRFWAARPGRMGGDGRRECREFSPAEGANQFWHLGNRPSLSPSPQPSPAGRGGKQGRPCTIMTRRLSPSGKRRFSLSPRALVSTQIRDYGGRSVPEAHLRIAQRFNAGTGWQEIKSRRDG